MDFNLEESIKFLERTPSILSILTEGISIEWSSANDGPDTWSVYDIIGHLIHGEKEDWTSRLEIILSDDPDKTFESFDRFAQFANSKGKTLQELLNEFRVCRAQSIELLKSKNITGKDLLKKGVHPDLGGVTLSQLLATWVVHDLNHLSQISRVMAKQYSAEVGPWIAFLGILK